MTTDLKALQQKAKLPVTQSGMGTLKQYLEANKEVMSSVLPKHVTADRMLKLAIGAVRTTPKLQECSTQSLFGAVVLASQFGLEPNTPLQECFLIPYVNSRKVNGNWVKIPEVQFQLGAKGLVKLARRSGKIKKIKPGAFYSNDLFEYEFGVDEYIRHKPATDGDRGELQGFYAYAKLENGETQFIVLSTHDVNERHRSRSQAFNNAEKNRKHNSPWHTDYVAMGQKTALKVLCKELPQSMEDHEALNLVTAMNADTMADVKGTIDSDTVLSGSFDVIEGALDEDDDAEGSPEETPPQATSEQQPAKPKAAKKKTAKKPAPTEEAPQQPDPGPEPHLGEPDMPPAPPPQDDPGEAVDFDDGPDEVDFA